MRSGSMGIILSSAAELKDLDAVIVAVAHTPYRDTQTISAMLKPNAVVMDVKSLFTPSDFPAPHKYWSL